MNCEQMLELLSARLDGELNQTEEQTVQAHLEQCPECRALWEQLSALQFSLEDLEPVPAPDHFAQGVMARVRQESRRPKVVSLWKHRQVRALAGVAACAVLVVGLSSIRMGSSKEAAAPMAPAPEAAMITAESGMAAYVEESASVYQKSMDAVTESAFEEPVATPMEPMEPIVPTGDESPAAVGCSELRLERLPDGWEEILGEIFWQEDGNGMYAEITGEQAKQLIELTEEQGMSALVGLQFGNMEQEGPWILYLDQK